MSKMCIKCVCVCVSVCFCWDGARLITKECYFVGVRSFLLYMGYLGYSIGFVPLGGEDQEYSELFPWQHVARVQVLHIFCSGQGRTVRLSQMIDFHIAHSLTAFSYHHIENRCCPPTERKRKGMETTISKLWKQLPY